MIHTLKGEIIVKSNVERLHFEEESRLIASGSGNITCDDAAAAGRATACEKGSILVSHGSGTGADALAYAFASGASAAGARCVFAGECCAPAAAYAAKALGCTAGCHVHTEITASLSLFSGDGLPLYRSYEEKIEKAQRSCPTAISEISAASGEQMSCMPPKPHHSSAPSLQRSMRTCTALLPR